MSEFGAGEGGRFIAQIGRKPGLVVVTLSPAGPGARYSVTTSGDGGEPVTVVVTGEVDLLAAPQLRTALLDATESGATEVALDLSAVSFIDSTVSASSCRPGIVSTPTGDCSC